MYPFERFSEDAKKVLTLAQQEAELHPLPLASTHGCGRCKYTEGR